LSSSSTTDEVSPQRECTAYKENEFLARFLFSSTLCFSGVRGQRNAKQQLIDWCVQARDPWAEMEDQKKVPAQRLLQGWMGRAMVGVLAAVCIQLIWPPPHQYLNELRFLTPEEIAALAEKIIADSTKVRRPPSIPSLRAGSHSARCALARCA
jgi:hypothetical protein